MKSWLVFFVLCGAVILNFHSASSSVIRTRLEKMRSSENGNHVSHSRKAPHDNNDASDSDLTVVLLVNRRRRNAAETKITEWQLHVMRTILQRPVYQVEVRDLPPAQRHYDTCLLNKLKETHDPKRSSNFCRRKHPA